MTERTLRQLLVRNMPSVCWTSVENVATSGVFDLNGLLDDRDIWVELKVAEHGNPWTVLRSNLRRSQRAWILRRTTGHGPSNMFALVRVADTISLYDVHGVKAAATRGQDPGSWFRTSKPFDWEGLQQRLFVR